MTEFSRPRRRRSMQPIVSPVPPQQRIAAQSGAGAAVERGRVIAVFGAPGAGVSTILRCLASASATPTLIVPPDEDDFEGSVRTAGVGAEAIFLDGFPIIGLNENGQPMGHRAVQYLYDRRLVFPGSGAVVRVDVDPELLVRAGRATAGGIHSWYAGLSAAERHIRTLGLPYYVIHNEPGEQGLIQAVSDLARRANLTR